MINEITNDIYRELDTVLIEKGYWNMSLADKKKLINQKLMAYTMTKMDYLGLAYGEQQPTDDYEDLFFLFETISDNLTIRKSEKFFDNYTHYVMRAAATLQGRAIIWYVEPHPFETPRVEFDSQGWDKLVTHKKNDPLVITKKAITAFNREFYLTNEQKGCQKILK